MHFQSMFLYKRVVIALFIVQTSQLVNAQEQTELKINKSTPIIKTKLRDEPPPKFMIVNYSWIQTANTTTSRATEHSRLAYQDLDAYLKFPIYVKKNIQVIGGLEYGLKNVQVGDLAVNDESVLQYIRNANFHRVGGEVLVKLNVNEKNYLYGYSAASLNYDKIQINNFQGKLNGIATLMHGIRRSADTDFGYGVGVAYTSGRYIPFPVVLYSHYFSSRWKLTMLIPNNIEMRYSRSPELHFYLLLKPSGRSYLVNESASAAYNQLIFNKSDVQIATSIERELHNWLWFRVRVGYNIPVNYSFSTSYEATMSTTDIGLDVSSFGFATFTLFGVVPKTLLKKAKGR